ncbi:MAG: asparagine synthetase B, partial [Candidatus Zixiibacteriota bacterium]
MLKRLAVILLFIAGLTGTLRAAALLVPMDDTQTDHLKAYGLVYKALEAGHQAQWLLNYRGGSFLIAYAQDVVDNALLMGVATEKVTTGQVADIYRTIEAENMERVELEKAPSIAVYSPPTLQPWDDAVTLALTYAEIPYDVIWDEDVLAGKLEDYDWLHCHHEDFTGQYGKFYAAFRNQLWY